MTTSTTNLTLSQALSLVQADLQAQRFAEALAKCKVILQQLPENFEALHAAGLCCCFLGQFEDAVDYYTAAVKRNPNSFKLFLNISNLYQELGEYQQAIHALEHCLKIDPKSPVAFSNMGNVLNKLGLDPELVANHYRMAISFDPGYAEAYMNLASFLTKLGQGDAANEVVVEGAKQCPRHPGILALYAMYCGEHMGDEEARTAYERLAEIEPDSALAIVRLLSLAKKHCDWDGERRYRERFLAVFNSAFSDQVKVATVNKFINHIGPFELLAVDVGMDHLKRVTEQFALNRQRSIVLSPYCEYRPAKGKIRIGYVSADLNDHAVGLLIRDLFKYHDRTRFEITAYYLRGDDFQSDVTREIAASCDHFKFCGNTHYAEIAKQIHTDGIDALVDLSGYTAGAKPQIFDMKPAPVQCQFLGYPGTLGSAMIDYYITTETYTPSNLAEHFTEQMVYLPEVGIATRGFDYAGALPTRAELGLPDDRFVFYCFSGFYRIAQDTFDAWLAVLKRAPNAVIWLFRDNPDGEERLLAYAEAQGVARDRFIFTERERITERGLHRLADALLDTIALPSGTAAIISLSDAVPIVTQAGALPQSRTCLAQLVGVGMEHLSADSVGGFIDLAVRMATEKAYFQQQREQLAQGLKRAPLFDQERYARHLEAAFEQMVARAREGGSPAPIRIEPVTTVRT